MEIKSLLLIAAAAACFTACDDDDNTNETVSAGKILFSTTVTNPDGSTGSGYLQAVSEFEGGVNYDNSNAIPLGFGSYPCVCKSGNIYVFPDYTGGTELKLKRYMLNEANELELKGAMSLPANSSAAVVCEYSTEKAYVACQALDMIIVFNPTTMTEISRIDVSTLRNDGVSAYPSAMLIRDGILYVGLEQYSSNWMPVEVSLEMALIDVTTDTIIKKIRNTSLGICGATRPVDAQSIFEDENGDIYVNCMGSFGYIPGLNSGIARIKKGETDFDETYCIDFTKTKVSGLECEYISCNFMCRYTSGGKMFGYAYSPSLDPTNTNTYLAKVLLPVVVDLYDKTITVLDGFPTSNGHGIAMGRHGDKMVYGSANSEYNGFCTIDLNTGEVETKVATVTGYPSFFYSFE